MIALTIGTLAPLSDPLSAPLSAALHRSPLQQSTSHLVIFAERSVGLQFFEPRLHSDEMVHPLRKNLSVFCGLSDFSGAPTREARVGQSPILIDYGQPLFVWLSRD